MSQWDHFSALLIFVTFCHPYHKGLMPPFVDFKEYNHLFSIPKTYHAPTWKKSIDHDHKIMNDKIDKMNEKFKKLDDNVLKVDEGLKKFIESEQNGNSTRNVDTSSPEVKITIRNSF